MKLKRVLAGLMAAVTAVTASVCGMSVSAEAYTNIDIWKNYEALPSGKEITLTLEPRLNESTSESKVYKIPVAKSGTFKMEISADTYYVQASFVKKQVTAQYEYPSTRVYKRSNAPIRLKSRTMLFGFCQGTVKI